MIKISIISGLLMSVVFLLPTFLVYLFPYTGLGRIIALPIIVIFSICVVIGYFYLVNKDEVFKKYPISSALGALVCIIFFNLVFYPQDSGKSIISHIKNYIAVYNDYDEIVFEDIYIPKDNYLYVHQSDSLQRYVAALHKFQDEIPYESSYSIYFAKDRIFANGKEVNPTLSSKNEIPQKLKTGAEKIFYDILEFRY